MESLNELNEAVNKVIEVSNKINDELYKNINNEAPLIVYKRMCNELVQIVKEYPSLTIKEIPKANNMMNAIEVLKTIYPELNNVNY